MTPDQAEQVRHQRGKISGLLVSFRIVLVFTGVLLWWLMLLLEMSPKIPLFQEFFLLVLIYTILLIVFCSIFDCFELGHNRIRELTVWYVLACFFADALSLLDVLAVSHHLPNIWLLIACWIIQSLVGMIVMRGFTRRFYKVYPVRNVCAVIQGNRYEKQTLAKMSAMSERYQIKRVIFEDEKHSEPDNVNLFEQFKDFNTVFIGDVTPGLRHEIIDRCFVDSRMVIVLPKPANIIFRGFHPIQVSDTLMYSQDNLGLTPEQRFFKRAVDIVGALIGIVLSAIPGGICAIIIKATDGGPVFYRQMRYTTNKETFQLLKLRSMRVDAEKDGARFTTPDDERITEVGRFMRRTRLDETPQFINVLKGDMSLVGPRAERIETTEAYSSENPMFLYRLKVKAGLTGYAQINGRYNTGYDDKLRMDLYYIEHYSLLGDISMMLETFKILFAPEATAGFDAETIDDLLAIKEN